MSIDRNTGVELGLLEDIRQSVANLLATPPGARPMRPDYGSRLHSLIDSPLNARGMARLVEATVSAITAYEKRIRVRRVRVDVSPGAVIFDIEGDVRGTGTNLSVEVPR